MQTLKEVQKLCANLIASIEKETSAEKPNKAAHARLRNDLSQLKKLVTPAKSESMNICKK